MALPKLNTPTYELVLPSTGEKIKYRPFLVREQKILLIAQESKDDNQIADAMGEIVKICTFNSVDPETSPMFDIEYLLLQIRGKSVGEIANFKVICPDDKITAGDVEINLSEVNVQVDDEHNNKIVIDETRNLGLVLNYPSLGITKAGFDVNSTDVDTMFGVVAGCIDHIFEGEKTFPAKDSTQKELKEFLEGLPQSAFLKIRKFFDTMPQLRHEIEVENPKTKVKNKITFKGLQDFFQ